MKETRKIKLYSATHLITFRIAGGKKENDLNKYSI